MLNNKILIFLFLLLTFSSCEYSPVYKNLDKTEIKIEVLEAKGDDLVNFFINSKLKIYSKSKLDKIYKINITTDFEKKDLSKDKTGKVTNYQLNLRTIFSINLNEIQKNIVVEENFTMSNSDNAYNNKESENVIKREFANNAVEKLISQLIFF